MPAMNGNAHTMKKVVRVLFVAVVVFFAIAHADRAYALDPSLIIVSPAPGEVVASTTVNAIIDTDVGLADTPDGSGYVVEFWMDAPTSDRTRVIVTNQRGYIFQNVSAGLHTLRVAIADRAPNGTLTPFTESSVEFEVAPPIELPVVGSISWYSVFRDGVIFSFPIIALALLFLWMHFIIRRQH